VISLSEKLWGSRLERLKKAKNLSEVDQLEIVFMSVIECVALFDELSALNHELFRLNQDIYKQKVLDLFKSWHKGATFAMTVKNIHLLKNEFAQNQNNLNNQINN
jgi:hypothetical protein